MQKVTTHQFYIKNKLFELEFLEFILDDKQIVHVEFYQILNDIKIQDITANLDLKETFRVFKAIVIETHKRYKTYNIALFSSLDGNQKRELVYKLLVRKVAKSFKIKSTIFDTKIDKATLYLLSYEEIPSQTIKNITYYLDDIGYLKL